jgi:hypothetical protein
MVRKSLVLSIFLIAIGVNSVFAQNVTGNTKGINPSLLSALREYARLSGKDVHLNWSGRTYEEQKEIYDRWLKDGGHLSTDCPGPPECSLGRGPSGNVHRQNREAAVPGRSKHEIGEAADVSGLQWTDCTLLNRAGLRHTVRNEPWHVELGDTCSPGLDCVKSQTQNNTQLNGVWNRGDIVITINGSNAVFTKISPNTPWGNVLKKGSISIGDLDLRNITPKGNLSWSAEALTYNGDYSIRGWINCTITMDANGKAMRIVAGNSSGISNPDNTFTRVE